MFGAEDVTIAKIAFARAAMFPRTSPDTKILTTMAAGATSRSMAMFGRQSTCRTAGLHIVLGTGPTYGRGAGHGSTMSRGASRLSTTVAGLSSAAAGAGFQGRLRSRQ